MAGDPIEQKVTQPEQIEEGGNMDYRKSAEGGYNEKILNHEAKQGAEAEHNLSLIQALKTYKRAALWSICKFPPLEPAVRSTSSAVI
jgi:SP family general alpha glucoside:H+ symporter-like MFS transporter